MTRRLVMLATSGLLVVGLAFGSFDRGASAQDATTTTAPSGPTECTEGLTFQLLERQDPHVIVVKASEANIRELPGLGCPIVRSVGKGKKLKATGRQANSDQAVWLEVRGKKFGKGWIYQGLVRET